MKLENLQKMEIGVNNRVIPIGMDSIRSILDLPLQIKMVVLYRKLQYIHEELEEHWSRKGEKVLIPIETTDQKKFQQSIKKTVAKLKKHHECIILCEGGPEGTSLILTMLIREIEKSENPIEELQKRAPFTLNEGAINRLREELLLSRIV
ncbi:MAG: hypothetical protein Q7T34_02540 [Candidatus Parcubacteria bacterium]|nr:hypothetical protein [Candidatus Parcubacteria bacterium]